MGLEHEVEGAAVYTIATHTIRAAFKPGLQTILKILLSPFALLTAAIQRGNEKQGRTVAPEFKPQYEMLKKRLEYQRIDPKAGIHGWNETDWPGSTLAAYTSHGTATGRFTSSNPNAVEVDRGRPVLTVDDEELWKE